jgi:secondary thiamine-phosphate synthase enzyme
MYKEINLKTEASECLINITEEIQQAVGDSDIKEGVCVVFVPHTTAGITINSGMDELTLKDIITETHRLVPTRVDFNHTFDTPADAAGHIKSVLIGNSLSLIIKNGELVIGDSQSVMFFEFDGPRSRRVLLRILGESE